MTSLRYSAPATTWTECLPLGDGSLGAMLDGGLPMSRIELNHEGAWSGSPRSESRHGLVSASSARTALAKGRQLLESGEPRRAAEALAPLQARYSQAFVPLGTLRLVREAEAAERGDYVRSLDLATAVHTLSAGSLRERTIVSNPFGVLAMQSTVALAIDLISELTVTAYRSDDDGCEMVLRLPSDVSPPFEGDRYAAAEWATDPDDSIEAIVAVRSWRTATGTALLLAAGTSYIGPGRPLRSLADIRADVHGRLARATTAGITAVFRDGERAHAALFGRSEIRFGSDRSEDGTPTHDRLRTAFVDPVHPLSSDPDLAGLLFDHGRYLAISASQRGSALPPTLQGIWNRELRPPWSCNYTLNINAEMNHWSAHTTNMPETAEAWLDFVEALSRAGSVTAKRLYDAPGWAAHHNSDAWLFSSPVGEGQGDARWSHWPMAAAWLVRTAWEGIAFGAGRATAERLWPIARGAAEFGLAWQRPSTSGGWTTSPATSPENTYLADDGTEAALDTGSAMDDQLLQDLFEIVGRLAGSLGLEDDAVATRSAERLRQIAGEPATTSDGIVREWAQERREADPGHRHLSSLYGLFPGPGLWAETSRDAAARTLERRGDESTGWSLIWKIGLWARLGRGDKVGDLLALLFRDAEADRGLEAGGLYPNLFAAHPPFQIDANLGYPGVLAECILQSHDGIELLPAVPPQLRSGSARGLVARPGVEVDIEWRDGELTHAVLRPRFPTAVEVRWRGRRRSVTLSGAPVIIEPGDLG